MTRVHTTTTEIQNIAVSLNFSGVTHSPPERLCQVVLLPAALGVVHSVLGVTGLSNFCQFGGKDGTLNVIYVLLISKETEPFPL